MPTRRKSNVCEWWRVVAFQGMEGRRREPLSLSELKRLREEEKERESRPVFLSEQQRKYAERVALLEKRAEEKASRAPEIRKMADSKQSDGRKRRRPPSISHVDDNEDQDSTVDPNERLAIRRQYMTQQKRDNSVSVQRGSERSRFRFEWDTADDTMRGEDSLRLELRRKMEKGAVQYGRLRQGGTGDLFPSSRRRSATEAAVGENSHPKARSKKRARVFDDRRWSEKPREDMTDRDWRIFREDFLISVRGTGVQHPARDWPETGLPVDILRLVSDVANYKKPSPIQMATIPICLQRRDVIGLAETGSGKTASYVLPMLVHISRMPRMTPQIACHGPYALVLAPTRELALQIDVESRKFAGPLGFRVVTVIGGQGLDEQATSLQAGCEIVICTPGRLVDLISRRMAALSNCNFVVLDEADRMVDMGFEPQVQEILAAMPSRNVDVAGHSKTEPTMARGTQTYTRQTLMFSATMSPAVERLARSYLLDPVIVTIGETGQAADNVDQRVEYFDSEGRKRERLIDLLTNLEAPILVFVNTKSGCEVVARFIEAACGIRTAVMHSGKSQENREKNLEGFRVGRIRVLIATDVLGRGIDIKGVKNVVNYELPKSIEAYTHRIGRTGRAGEKGTAWSLTTAADTELFPPLRAILAKAGASIPQQISRFDPFAGGAAGSGRNGRQPTYGKPIID